MSETPHSDKNPDEEHSDAELAARRDKLNAALEARRRQEEAAQKPKPGTSAAGYAAAFRLSTEFIAGIAVGAMIGWLIDQFVGTAPFGMIIFLMLGFVAGVLNVLRSAGLIADPHARLPSKTKRAGPFDPPESQNRPD